MVKGGINIARKVKCRITGEYGTNETFYKDEDGKYYKSKEIYDSYIKDKELKQEIVIYILRDILQKRNGSIPGIIVNKLNNCQLSLNVIYDELIKNKDKLIEISKVQNCSDYSIISAIFNYCFKKYEQSIYAGCYEIRNNLTNEVYIGESINIFKRFSQHISDLYNNKHHCQKLQEAFNITHDISNFTFTPLYMFKILSYDKKVIKEETLYLETAFYLMYRQQKKQIYNTINLYQALKKNEVSLNGYHIDNNNVLVNLYHDKYNVLPKKIKNAIRKDLSDIIIEETKCENIKADKDSNKEKKYFMSSLLKELSEKKILPENYDYNKVRCLLRDNGLIEFDENNRTVATDYSLNENLFVVKGQNKNGSYSYNLTEKCKDKFIEIFSSTDVNLSQDI